MESSSIIITEQDLERLQKLVGSGDTPALARLATELGRAKVVAQKDIPPDVVTMNSDVTFVDTTTGSERKVRLVYPKDADAERGWVSVLAPMGSALLGLSKGQEIEWPTPGGVRRVRVVEIHYQPERAGDFEL
ncbi:MAG TPA: nucleoside diphosphate kinase regulator [Polyangiaceae bacterium]|nr:nucleoside diphosphate kinase regulator [Polyangiaceae bacterium]